MAMPSLLLSLVAGFIVYLPLAAAQGTNATCLAGYEWMTNSKGQSPCLVSSWLFTPCSSPAESWVYPLTPGFHYNTPLDNLQSATPCRCNTVLFSTIAACATCQGQGEWIVPWNTYSQNCTAVYTQKYPESIPLGTAIPTWAYLDITTNNTFNPVAAQALEEQNIPDSTAIPQSTTSTGSSSSTDTSGFITTAPTSQVTNSPSDTSSNTKKSSNVGAIVGGVVGGIVGALAIGAAAFYFLRYRRNRLNSASLSSGVYSEQTPYAQKFTAQGNVQSVVSHDDPKLYNPEDPSTFPDAGQDRSTHYETSFGYPSVNYQHSAYTGAPEI